MQGYGKQSELFPLSLVWAPNISSTLNGGEIARQIKATDFTHFQHSPVPRLINDGQFFLGGGGFGRTNLEQMSLTIMMLYCADGHCIPPHCGIVQSHSKSLLQDISRSHNLSDNVTLLQF